MSKFFDIAPIPTKYNGVNYRSRVEARWAILFDSVGLRHTHEPDGYGVQGGAYLPDFWLPDVQLFFEVKGVDPSADEIGKCLSLATRTNRGVLLAVGIPEEKFQIRWYAPEGEREGLFALAHDRFAAGGFWLVAEETDTSLGPYHVTRAGGPCFAGMAAAFDAARSESFARGRCDRRYPAIPFPEDAALRGAA